MKFLPISRRASLCVTRSRVFYGNFYLLKTRHGRVHFTFYDFFPQPFFLKTHGRILRKLRPGYILYIREYVTQVFSIFRVRGYGAVKKSLVWSYGVNKKILCSKLRCREKNAFVRCYSNIL